MKERKEGKGKGERGGLKERSKREREAVRDNTHKISTTYT